MGVRLFYVLSVLRAVLLTVLIGALIAAGTAGLILLTDLPQFLVFAVWIAPVVVLIPYVYSSAERRPYGLWTAVAALVLPAATTAWVVWLFLAHGVIGRHP
jgi:hypothetical protein